MTVDASTWTEVTDEAALRELLGTPSGAAVGKERTALHELDRQWIAASPFLLMATSGADGTCDVSPKGDPAGFVHVLDDMTVQGHRPLLALVVDVEQVFHHCGKAFLRSQLWAPESWDDHGLPRRAVIARTLERPQADLEELDAYYGPAYAERLYRQT